MSCEKNDFLCLACYIGIIFMGMSRQNYPNITVIISESFVEEYWKN